MEVTSLFSGAIVGSFLTAIFGVLITGYFNIKSKNKEYENSYAKMILEKRLSAYEQVNQIINILKKAVLDLDGKAYHIIFSSKEDFDIFFKTVYDTFSLNFWLSEKTKKSYKNASDEIIRCSCLMEKDKNIRNIGKEEYQYIGKLRDELEKNNLLVDLKDLYKIDKFFNQKKIETAFVERKLTDRPN